MTRADNLADWVAAKHAGQVIRRTEKPYFSHLLAVAELAKPAAPLGYEIGLCHDLLEETATSEKELLHALISFGYTDEEALQIAFCVVELTDVFTSKAYPESSKKQRKEKEAARLVTISPAAQTVKYGDLIYNTIWVLKYDQKHAHKYLVKKQLLLTKLDQGNQTLRKMALDLLHIALGM